jgi:hypothetical protein
MIILTKLTTLINLLEMGNWPHKKTYIDNANHTPGASNVIATTLVVAFNQLDINIFFSKMHLAICYGYLLHRI